MPYVKIIGYTKECPLILIDNKDGPARYFGKYIGTNGILKGNTVLYWHNKYDFPNTLFEPASNNVTWVGIETLWFEVKIYTENQMKWELKKMIERSEF